MEHILPYSKSAKQMSLTTHESRHPAFLQKGGLIASAARDFSPPQELCTGLIEGLPWGERTLFIGGRDVIQYMVYDREARNVLSCRETPEASAQAAIARLRYESALPEEFNPRLQGTKFCRVPSTGYALVHGVTNAQGSVIGRGHTRQEAMDEAVSMVCSHVDAPVLTFEEFCRIAPTVQVQAGRGRSELPAVYIDGDSPERNAVRKMLRQIWRCDAKLRQGEGADCDKFILRREADLLRAAAPIANSHVVSVDVGFLEGEHRMMVLFRAQSVSATLVQREAYRQYLVSQVERCEAQQQAALRERA